MVVAADAAKFKESTFFSSIPIPIPTSFPTSIPTSIPIPTPTSFPTSIPTPIPIPTPTSPAPAPYLHLPFSMISLLQLH